MVGPGRSGTKEKMSTFCIHGQPLQAVKVKGESGWDGSWVNWHSYTLLSKLAVSSAMYGIYAGVRAKLELCFPSSFITSFSVHIIILERIVLLDFPTDTWQKHVSRFICLFGANGSLGHCMIREGLWQLFHQNMFSRNFVRDLTVQGRHGSGT